MLSVFFRNEPVSPYWITSHEALERRRRGSPEVLEVRRVSGELDRILPAEAEFRYESLDVCEIARAGSAVRILPERGGLVSSISVGGVELLSMDEDSLFDASQNVKGGVPYLFPNAGPISPSKQQDLGTALPQHGFARTLPWEAIVSSTGHACVQELRSERVPARYGYPADWRVVNTVSIEEGGSVRLAHRVENHSDAPLPLSSGLHPYFRVPGSKRAIAWEFEWGDEIARQADKWAEGEAHFGDWPGENPVRARIPGLGTLVLRASPDYRRLWIWSMPGRDFVCIEPTMNHPDGLADSPVAVRPRSAHESWLSIGFEPEAR